jgi:AcrR family transcriptional regulator
MPKVTEAHVEARRSQILIAACKCFSDKGFHQTTVRDICDRAGLSAGAVYGYFKSKDEILEAVGKLGRENTRAALGLSQVDAAQAPSLKDILGTMMRFVNSEMIRDSSRLDVRMWGEALHTPQLRKLFLAAGANLIEPLAEAVRRGQEHREIATDLDPEAVARVCVALALGFTVQVAMDPEADLSGCPAVVAALLDGSFAATE